MSEFTYHDYLLHKVVQPFSLRGQEMETITLRKNIPLYLTRQAGKLREQMGSVDSKANINSQAVQNPPSPRKKDLNQMHALQEALFLHQPLTETKINTHRTKPYLLEDNFNDNKDPIICSIKNKIAMEKFVDDNCIFNEGVKQKIQKQEVKLSVAQQIKTVLQEKFNEDQLKKMYKKYILETMKTNIAADKTLHKQPKQHTYYLYPVILSLIYYFACGYNTHYQNDIIK